MSEAHELRIPRNRDFARAAVLITEMAPANRIIVLTCVAALLALATAALAGPAPGPQTERASVSSTGGQGDRYSGNSSLSRSGRFVAFTAIATNLVPGDTNGKTDVFVRDRATGTTERVSLSSTGAQGNRQSVGPSISSDGRYVAFASRATNLVPGDNNHKFDVFVRDRILQKTSMVSVGPNGKHEGSEPAISGDGRSVAFVARIKLDKRGTNAGADVYVHHLKTHRTERVSVTRSGKPPDHASYDPSLSDNGRFVAFTSIAGNLVRGDSQRSTDIFIRDLKRRVTKRIGGAHPASTGETFNPALSGNGRFVAFFSSANEFYDNIDDNRHGIFRRDLKTGATQRLDVRSRRWAQRLDVKSSGGPARGDGPFNPALSDDGEIAVFSTGANNLVPDDTNIKGDVFVRDIPNHTTTRASVDSAGRQVFRHSGTPVISGDGRFAAFQSNARNLVSGDTNIKTDVFVRGPLRP